MKLAAKVSILLSVLLALPSGLGKSADFSLLQRPGDDLYTPSDKLDILDSSNFRDTIYGKKHGWVVEFYNSHCGFCKTFATTWKKFASQVYSWRTTVKIGVVNCANVVNTGICRDFEIMDYPSIKYFHSDYKEGPDKIGQLLTKGSNPQELIEILIQTLRNEQNLGRGENWPELNIQNFTNIDQMQNLSKNIEATFVIIENIHSTLGSEIILDTINTNNIKIWSLSELSPVAKVLKPISIPSLYIIKKNLDSKLISIKTNRNDLLNDLLTYLNNNHIESLIQTTTPQNVIKPSTHRDSIVNEFVGNTVYQSDLEATLRFTLHEIVLLKNIRSQTLTALKDYIQLLLKYFPFKGNTKAFITDLYLYINQQNEIDGANMSDMIKHFEEINSPAYSTDLEWIACKGSTEKYRGYTCGLWTMFHLFTVSEDKQDPQDKTVLKTMRSYIKNFFGCTHCAEHFETLISRYPIDVFKVKHQSVYWLWFAHNQVNQRLAGDVTDDPMYPKRKFPYKKDCEDCINDNEEWNLDKVMSYVMEMYDEDNLNLINSLSMKSSATSSFNKTVLGFLYFYCVLSAVLIIRMVFNRKMYKKKPYNHNLFGKV